MRSTGAIAWDACTAAKHTFCRHAQSARECWRSHATSTQSLGTALRNGVCRARQRERLESHHRASPSAAEDESRRERRGRDERGSRDDRDGWRRRSRDREDWERGERQPRSRSRHERGRSVSPFRCSAELFVEPLYPIGFCRCAQRDRVAR